MEAKLLTFQILVDDGISISLLLPCDFSVSQPNLSTVLHGFHQGFLQVVAGFVDVPAQPQDERPLWLAQVQLEVFVSFLHGRHLVLSASHPKSRKEHCPSCLFEIDQRLKKRFKEEK